MAAIALTSGNISRAADLRPGVHLFGESTEKIYRIIGAGAQGIMSPRLTALMHSGWEKRGFILTRGHERMLTVEQSRDVAWRLRAIGRLDDVVRYHHVLERIAADYAKEVEYLHWEIQHINALAPGETPAGIERLAKLRSIAFAPGRRTFGDFRESERNRIQWVVNQAGEGLFVVGSAARGERRNVGRLELPFGKGENRRSDIDYMIPLLGRSRQRFNHILPGQRQPLSAALPDIDAFLLGAPDVLAGNAIYFSPGETRPFLLVYQP